MNNNDILAEVSSIKDYGNKKCTYLLHYKTNDKSNT